MALTLLLASGVLPPSGEATVLSVIAPASAAGLTASFQGLTFGTGGLDLTNLEQVLIKVP